MEQDKQFDCIRNIQQRVNVNTGEISTGATLGRWPVPARNSISQYGHNRKLLWTHRSNTTFPDRKSIKLTQLKYKTDVFQASIEDLQ